MKARVKLLTPWSGPLPEWMPLFKDRLAASKLVEHELIETTREEMNALATARLRTPCRKARFYDVACDLRPAYGEVFADLYRGHEFWGWCDLDVVFGDLDRLFLPLLDAHDVVTLDRHVHGPFCLLRNDPYVVSLFRQDPAWTEVLADPDYWNWDETGFDDGPEERRVNPSFSRLVKKLLRAVHHDDRAWVESCDPLPDSGGAPSRGCEVLNRRLLETPSRRELLAYHFTRLPKTWPVGRHRDLFGRQLKYAKNELNPPNPPAVPALPELPVTSAAYWDARVEAVLGAGLPIHQCAWDGPEDKWLELQAAAVVALQRNVPEGSSVLDVGCGHGALAEAMPDRVSYVGVDVSRKMLDLVPLQWLTHQMDGRDLGTYPEDSFDWCVCRGLEGSVRVREGNREWARFRDEMLRVAPRVLLLDYSGGAKVLRREDYRC